LGNQQLEALEEAERTLGARILLAYRPDTQEKIHSSRIRQNGLKVAPLNSSQLECLQGLEMKLDSIVVAYQ
jgi:hypothetical protein